ncbi:flavodoxin family protein [Proteiniborus sp. MB09-C3]|uniref:flavodoxin family protein n=1 Tax=Proteiniborus sp. MB09-C3 TaxID=3050072 RepID=UPI002554D99E|nr:flavodoxin family protein [Proteiniborus sp. MB09-C3]WIV11266.1 flavodoxin family protein [Proteiniborus sp. MB09-C3]
MKKVLAVMGSPRKNKNTDKLLDKVIEGLKTNEVEVKKAYLKDLKFSPCISCGNCERTGDCFMDDDMKSMYEDFNSSDIIIIASPLYFNTVSSLTKMMIDRCQVYWSSKYVLKNPSIDVNKKRIGMFICVGGAPKREGHFDACIPVMDLFFKAINTEYRENIFASHTDEIPVWERKEILDLAFEKGKELSKHSINI